MSAGWIIAVLVLFLIGIVTVLELLCHSIRDGLTHERTEQDVKRRRWIANVLNSRRRY